MPVKQKAGKAIAEIVNTVVDSNTGETREKLKDDEYILFGKVRKLKPLEGKEARIAVPKMLSLATQLLTLYKVEEVELSFFEKLFSQDEDVDATEFLFELFRIIDLTVRYLNDHMQEIEEKYIPLILNLTQEDIERLREEGSVHEVWYAIFRACVFLWKKHGNPEVIAALRYRPNSRKN